MGQNRRYGLAAALVVLTMTAAGCSNGSGGSSDQSPALSDTAAKGQQQGQEAQKQAQQQQQKQAQQQQQQQKQAQQQQQKQQEQKQAQQQQQKQQEQKQAQQQQQKQQEQKQAQQQQGKKTLVGSLGPVAGLDSASVAGTVQLTALQNQLGIEVQSQNLQAGSQYLALVRQGASCTNEQTEARQVLLPLQMSAPSTLQLNASVDRLDEILAQGTHVILMQDNAQVACAVVSE